MARASAGIQIECLAMSSPFLRIPSSDWVAENNLAFAVRDKYAVSPGHTLVIPKELVPTWFDASRELHIALMDLVDEVKRDLDQTHKPAGFNVGFNAGEAAGQTVMHLHVHVIPRYIGDMDDPRGGVRHVIPWKGNYVRPQVRPLATGGPTDPFFDHICPLIDLAENIAIIAAFVKDSGLAALERPLLAALDRGACVQLLTGDYLGITQADALRRLLTWTALENDGTMLAPSASRRLEARIIEIEKLSPPKVFHPKCWRFEGECFAVAFVGSSNISRSALGHGIEWNLRADRATNPEAYQLIVQEFDSLWSGATKLNSKWVEEYARRVALAPNVTFPGEDEDEAPEEVPAPHPIQQEALAALREAREQGHRRALVVLGTGLGKTWLAAFDVRAVAEERGIEPRVLFLAHRAPLLGQAVRTFRPLLSKILGRPPREAWFADDMNHLDGDLVVATVQKLSRPENLRLLAQQRFDYAIVDEVHHATARTYRDILGHLNAGFLLGLTATPDRTDQASVRGLFDDKVAYRADLGDGIAHGRLVPFVYHGIKDTVSYDDFNIPWRGKRFDPVALASAVQTQARMEQLWAAWEKYPGQRTLIFCASIGHADFVHKWLKAKGVQVEIIHSGLDTDVEKVLERLEDGALDAVCAVDMLNEGIDVPEIDRVVMLRPTESVVVLLQQIGRGLRKAAGKAFLTIIDFVGNHRFFVERVRMLLSLGDHVVSVAGFLNRGLDPVLPRGCSVELEIEVKDMLLRFLPRAGRNEMIEIYREMCQATGRRPMARDFFHLGFLLSDLHPRSSRDKEGGSERPGWFDFVLEEDKQASEEDRKEEVHLRDGERRVLQYEGALSWFRRLERTGMEKSFKMVLLSALCEAGALHNGMALTELAERSLQVLRRSPDLMRDIAEVKALRGQDLDRPSKSWLSYWRDTPVHFLATGDAKQWFSVDGDRFVPRLPIAPGEDEAFAGLMQELIDYRLADYISRDVLVCTVLGRGDALALQLPKRKGRDVPEGDIDVRLTSGHVWQFKLLDGKCTFAAPAGWRRNRLPDLLHAWFGEGATQCEVRLLRPFAGGEWTAEAVGGKVIRLPLPVRLPAYRDLRAAADAVIAGREAQSPGSFDRSEIMLLVEHEGDDLFAVRASGQSMDGGEHPIHDDDWLVMRPLRNTGFDGMEGKVVLVEVPDKMQPDAHLYLVKRLARTTAGWVLRSDNPEVADLPAPTGSRPVAMLLVSIKPNSPDPA